MSVKITPCVLVTLVLIASLSHANPIVLVDEDFSDLAVGGADGGTWTTTDVSGNFELYNSPAGFTARAMSQTYGGASGIPGGTTVPGGQEILNQDSAVTVTLSVDLPSNLGAEGLFTFWAGQRISGGFGGFLQQIEIVNITDNKTFVSPETVNFANGNWLFNSYELDFAPSDRGDTLEFRFSESAGNAARGLQLADIQFSVQVTPEPTSLVLASVGILPFALSRRRRSARCG